MQRTFLGEVGNVRVCVLITLVTLVTPFFTFVFRAMNTYPKISTPTHVFSGQDSTLLLVLYGLGSPIKFAFSGPKFL